MTLEGVISALVIWLAILALSVLDVLVHARKVKR
jgi:hypothetical protein